MGRNQRIAFAAVAVVIAAVAVIALAGRSDPQTERADRAPATATGTSTPGPAGTPQPAQAQPQPAAPTTVRFRDGKVVGGLGRLEYKKGETATFAIASDTADEVHVHGYDLKKDVTAGGTVRFSFPADIAGIFEVELENSGTQLAQLRVDP